MSLKEIFPLYESAILLVTVLFTALCCAFNIVVKGRSTLLSAFWTTFGVAALLQRRWCLK